ncbi:hypothetical protein Tco_1022546 [Tanacetum coccineum]
MRLLTQEPNAPLGLPNAPLLTGWRWWWQEWGGRGGREDDDGDMVVLVGGDDEVVGVAMIGVGLVLMVAGDVGMGDAVTTGGWPEHGRNLDGLKERRRKPKWGGREYM